MARSFPLAPALAALLAFGGCAREPEGVLPPVHLDLAALAPTARPVAATRAIDLGAPSARAHLLSGWGPDETAGTASFVWGGGDRSALAFEMIEPRDLVVRLRGWSYPFEDGRGQVVTMWVNGAEIGRHKFLVAPETWTVEIPERRLERGENRLELGYAREQPGRPDIPRAAAWDGVRFGDRAVPAAARLDVATGTVELPAGTAVDWALELPGDAWLVWDRVEASGGARLEVGVRGEAPGSERAERRARGGRARLTGAAGGLVSFGLRSLGAVGEVRVVGLRVHAVAPSAPSQPEPTRVETGVRPNLLVYLIDTLRADHLGCYGYGRPTSPAIDAFARDAVVYEQGRAQSSWTKPAVATVLTGLYPIAHGAERRSERLPEAVETVAERLAAAGYETALFTTNANITEKFGFDQGWDEFRYLARSRGGRRFQHVTSAEINQAVFGWLARRDATRPFFLFVHTLDPHDPYQPEETFRRRLAPGVDVAAACCGRSTQLIELDPEAARDRARAAAALYDAEIAQNDAAFGALVAELERRGLARETAVLLTADHGEEFYDHGGWKHGWTLYEEVLRVPMVLRLPARARAGTRASAPADQIDIAPTLYELAGVETPSALPGRSLLARFGPEGEGVTTSFAWLERPGLALAAATRDRWKRIRFEGAWTPPLGRAPTSLYDLVRDPRELDDLAASRREPLRAAWLDGELRRALGLFHSRRAAEEAPIDAELEQSLRALGYF